MKGKKYTNIGSDLIAHASNSKSVCLNSHTAAIWLFTAGQVKLAILIGNSKLEGPFWQKDCGVVVIAIQRAKSMRWEYMCAG